MADAVLSMASLGKFVTLTSETALGISRSGVILHDIHDLTGQTRVDVAAYGEQTPARNRHSRSLQILAGPPETANQTGCACVHSTHGLVQTEAASN